MKKWNRACVLAILTVAACGESTRIDVVRSSDGPMPPVQEMPPEIDDRDWRQPRGRYTKDVKGFYLGHFERVGDLEAKECESFSKLLMRGGQPDLRNLSAFRETLVENGVGMIVDLRAENGGVKAERELAAQLGMTWVKLPLHTGGQDQPAFMEVEVVVPAGQAGKSSRMRLSNTEATQYVLRLVREALKNGDSRGVYLHCQRGEDRTGMFLALLRNCEAWKKEFRVYGGVMYPALKTHFENVRRADSR